MRVAGHKKRSGSLFKGAAWRCALSVLGALWWCAVPLHLAEAQFVRVGQVYTTPTTRVLAVPSRDESGLFVVSGPALPVQLFDLPTYPAEGSTSIFLRFNSESQAFTHLVTSRGEFKVTGSFTIVLGATRVSLDALSNSSPYVSVVDLHGPTPVLLGIVGTSVAVNASGARAAALLEAQIPVKTGQIQDYVLLPSGEVSVAGASLTADRIGVIAEFDNPCQEQNAVVVNAADSLLLQQRLKESSAHYIEIQEIIRRNEAHDPYRDLIILRVTPDSIVGFDYETGQFMVIRSVELNAGATKVRPLCTMSAVEIRG